MSFRQIFSRFTSIARASTSFNDWRGRDTFDEELRRAEELIRESRAKQEPQGSAQREPEPEPDGKPGGAIAVAYRTLGVRAESSFEEISRSYRVLIARFHPDRHANEGAEEQERASERAKQITEAYRIVKEHRGVR